MPAAAKNTLSLKFLATTIFSLSVVYAQHEDIPYQDIQNICDQCTCTRSFNVLQDPHPHYLIRCRTKGFNHILPRWPDEFGREHDGIHIEMDLSYNPIKLLQQLPGTSASLAFSCRHCGIERFQVPTFVDVPNLVRLDLAWNRIAEVELTADVFRGRYNMYAYENLALMELDLSFNRLHSLAENVFQHTPNLRKLHLAGNNFNFSDKSLAEALTNVRSLEVLDLSFTGIDFIPASVFANLTLLEILDLSGNKFANIPEHMYLLGRTLQVLKLAENRIERLSAESLSALISLKHLNVSNNGALLSIADGTFSRTPNMEYVHCSGNKRMQNFDLVGLGSCVNLTHVNISHCAIRSLSLPYNFSHVRSWPKMSILDVAGNPWLCNCALMHVFALLSDCIGEQRLVCASPRHLADMAIDANLDLGCLSNSSTVHQRKRYILYADPMSDSFLIFGVVMTLCVLFKRMCLYRGCIKMGTVQYQAIRSTSSLP